MADAPSSTDVNPDYWWNYGPLQAKKHELIKKYLQAWYPILASRSGKIVYFDTHAGRGTYEGGKEGSPIVALRTLLEHRSLSRILHLCEVTFVFVEQDPENLESLEQELARLRQDECFDGTRITVRTACGECFGILEETLNQLESSRNRIAPSLFFIDPYGFKLDGSIMSRILGLGHTEIIVNIMWHNIQQALGLGERLSGMQATLTNLSNTEAWATRLGPSLSDQQKADVAVDLLTEAYGARYGSALKMKDDRGGIKYFLLHLTNSLEGRKKMKEILWAVGGPGFFFRTSGSLNEGLLFGDELDVEPTKEWIRGALAQGGRYLRDLEDRFALTDWKDRHMTTALKELYKAGEIDTEPQMRGKALVRKRVEFVRLSRST